MSLVGFSGQRFVRALRRAGFEVVGQKGSHMKLRHPDGRVVIVPDHPEVLPGTARSILRQARLSESEMRALL